MKILIAEDAPVNQLLLTNFLKSYGECHVASDGQAAVDLFRESLVEGARKFDLVCLDIVMPELDGQAALQEIRHLEKESGIPGSSRVKVIMITALDDSGNIMEALVRGECEAYLTKPVSAQMIAQQLGELGLI